MSAEHDSPWLTVREAAKRARLGTAAIYAAISTHKLKAAKVGQKLLVHVEWLDAWLDASATIVNPDAPGAPHSFRLHRQA